jgi:hypothetical protein
LRDYYQIHRISGSWHLDHGADEVLVRGISLFTACQLYVFQLLAPELASNTQSGSLVQRLKKQGWDWHIKMAASWLVRRHDACASGTPRFVALYDIHNNAVVDSVAAVARELVSQGSTVIPVAADPKIAKRGVGSSTPIGYSSYYGIRDELECRRIWRGNRAQILAAIARFTAVHCQSPLQSDCSRYLRICLKQTIRDIIAMDNLYKAIAPAAVFMGTDTHKLGRISALLGHKYPWTTMVLQHGAPMLPHAYVPLHADCIAVWGRSFVDWFERHDVPARKMIVTGAPRFDCYFSARKNGGRGRKIVWLTTPADEEMVLRCFACIAPVLSATGLELVIKPHPSERSDTYGRIIADGNCGSATVAGGVQVKDVVNEGDLVFCLNSTAGIEAIALGGLLFVITIPSVPNSIPYHKYRAARVVDEASDIVTEVEEFIRYAGSETYLQEAERFLGDYLGILDGRSARRVCDFLLEKVSPKESFHP